MTVNPFHADALEINRRGALSDAQRQGFGSLSGSRRRSGLTSAGLLVAGSLLVAVYASPSLSMGRRTTVTGIGLAIAAFLVVRSVTGSDALTRDLREGRVESAEGAIGKRLVSVDSDASSYLLDVGNRTFPVAMATYTAAPEQGFVRIFYLPHSKKIVNLERLPDRPAPADLSIQGLAGTMGAAIHAHSRREMNEARADLGQVGEVLKQAVGAGSAVPAAGPVDPRPLGEAIVGTWSNALITVTFAADGTMKARVFGTDRAGHWSVDGSGRLHADITGQPGTADASISGTQLTVALGGRTVLLNRHAAN